MTSRIIKIMAVLATTALLTACKVEVVAVQGGDIAWSGGSCSGGSNCVIEITDPNYSKTFTVTPKPGYQFVKWRKAPGFLCGDSTSLTCAVAMPDDDTAAANIIATFTTSYIMPVYKDVGIDTDGDGVRNELDADDDNDGVLDVDDPCPLYPGAYCGVVVTDPVAISASSPSGYFDGVAGPSGNSAVVWSTSMPSGGSGTAYLQRFDDFGDEQGSPIDLISGGDAGGFQSEWLSNDSIAVLFNEYVNGFRRLELRIIGSNNSFVYSGTIIGGGADYLAAVPVDLGDSRMLVTWNRSPDHPQLAVLDTYAQVLDYAGNALGPAFVLASSSTGSTSNGIGTSTAVKLGATGIVVGIVDSSDGVSTVYSSHIFDWATGLEISRRELLRTPISARGGQLYLKSTSLGYVALFTDTTTGEMKAGTYDLDGNVDIPIKVLVEGVYDAGEFSLATSAGEFTALDVVYRLNATGPSYFQRFSFSLSESLTSPEEIFPSGYSPYLLELSTNKVRAFRNQSFADPIDFVDVTVLGLAGG